MNRHIESFLKVMDANDNSTGGGTASSIAGAMAAGLVGMVARLSKGKKELGPAAHYDAIAEKAQTLGRELFAGGSKDSAAFAVVSAAFDMPKGSDAKKTARSRAIRKGMTLCAQVPLENAALCSQVLVLCGQLAQSYNTSAASDLECARHLAEAGLKGCAANVRINLPYIKDESRAHDLEAKLQAVLDVLENCRKG